VDAYHEGGEVDAVACGAHADAQVGDAGGERVGDVEAIDVDADDRALAVDVTALPSGRARGAGRFVTLRLHVDGSIEYILWGMVVVELAHAVLRRVAVAVDLEVLGGVAGRSGARCGRQGPVAFEGVEGGTPRLGWRRGRAG